MCGIFGYVTLKGNGQTKNCLDGLSKLEYRGYDSAGIAGVSDGELYICKRAGKIASLKKAAVQEKLDIAIAHTRWATHGKPSEINAHPHTDMNNQIAIVHNGIIENYVRLKEKLQKNNIKFQSETDSEIIAQLIAQNHKGDFIQAVLKTSKELEGSFAFAAIHKDHPDTIAATACDCPLAIALCAKTKTAYLTSDPHALKEGDMKLLYLQKGEVAILKPDSISIYGPEGKQLDRAMQTLDLISKIATKGKFDHYMLKEIYEQPKAIQTILDHYAEFPNLPHKFSRILIIGCGSSCYAGEVAKSLFESVARIPTSVEIASEFRYSKPVIEKDNLVIAISQSGETADTLAALRTVKAANVPVIGICNVPHSTLAREADQTLHLHAGPEISVCSTKAFTAQVTLLSLLAHHLADNHDLLGEIQKLPQVAEQVLAKSDEIKEIAEKYARFKHFFFLGRQNMYAAGMEAALKLKEISYCHATALAAGELKHGPIALIDSELCTVALCGNSATLPKLLSNLEEVKARGGPILAFSPSPIPTAGDTIILPEISDCLAPIPYSIVAQLFAYHLAAYLGTNIDQPRNLAKSVTVE